MKALANRRWTVGLTAAVIFSLATAAAAHADPRWREDRDRSDHRGRPGYGRAYDGRPDYRDSRWRQPGYRYRQGGFGFVVVRRPRAVVVRPAYPDYFVVHRPRFVVVRPVPCWPSAYGNGVSARIGLRTGGLNLNFGFERRAPYYGCDFCGAYFSSYSAWEAHVRSCPEGPGGPVLCEPWDQGDVNGFREGAARAWQDYDPGDQGSYDEDN